MFERRSILGYNLTPTSRRAIRNRAPIPPPGPPNARGWRPCSDFDRRLCADAAAIASLAHADPDVARYADSVPGRN